jgi:predicted metal-dependent peptidase
MALALSTTKRFADPQLKPLNVEEVELTTKQSQLWDQTRAKFMWEAPGFCHILFSMMNPKRQDAKAIFSETMPAWMAATDGLYVYLKPSAFFSRPLGQRVFILAHEVCHGILNHLVMMHVWHNAGKVRCSDGTYLPFNQHVMNIAMDFIINDMLVQSKLGELPPEALHDPGLITHMDNSVDAYQKLFKQAKQQGGGGSQQGGTGKGGNTPRQPYTGPGKASGKSGFDEHFEPGTAEGKHPTEAAQERNEQEWKTAVAGAMASAQAQGKLPAAMKRMFTEILEPRVAWEDYIQGWFKRKLGAGSWNFQRPDRRLICRDPYIYAPGRSGFGADCVVLGMDTSGSITPATMDMWLGELSGILEDVNPERLVVLWCDAKVDQIDEPDDMDDVRRIKARGSIGGGGTDFRPVFDKVKELGLNPDALVYLTDGQGTFPQTPPSYHVLWGSILEPPKHYPFGEVVMVPKK